MTHRPYNFFVPNPLPVSSPTGGLQTTDFRTQVQAGLVPGWSIVEAMGEYEAGGTDADGEDVCRWQDFTPDGPVRLPTPSASGEQMTFVSDSAADSSINTGVRTARIEYLDDTGAEQTEDIVLTGTTPTNTTATNIRFVNDFYALTTGSNGVAEGNIAIYKQGGSIANDLYQMIALGGNKSLVPHRMVPLGKTLLLQEWHAAEAQGKRVAFRIRSTDMGGTLIPGVFCFKGTTYISGTASGPIPASATVPALSIVKVTAWPDAVGSEGSCGWWGYLVDD